MRKAPKDAKSDARIPRPPNAFILFRSDLVSGQYTPPLQTDLAVEAGQLWYKLDNLTKTYYYRQADQAKKEHKKKYPSYTYHPSPKRIRGPTKGQPAPMKRR